MKNTFVHGLVICSTLLAGCIISGPSNPPTGSTTQDPTSTSSTGGNTGGTGGTGGVGGTGGSTGGTGGTGGSIDGSIVCNGALGFEAGSPWPMEGCCPDRRSRTSLFGPSIPKTAWQLDLGSPILTPPVVDNEGWIYVITADGHLNAVQPDGTIGWSYAFAPSTQTRGTPAIGEDGTLYFGAEAGIFAVTLDGEKVWLFNAGGDKSAAAIGEDRTIYVYSSNGTLYALGPDGAPRWTLDTPPLPVSAGDGKPEPHVALDAAGNIHIGLANGVVQTVNPNGMMVSNSEQICGGPVRQFVVSHNSNVYAECANILYGLDPAGDIAWSTKDWGGGVFYQRPAVTSDGGLMVVDGGVMRVSSDGHSLWSKSLSIPYKHAGLALDGRDFVYVAASEDGKFRVMRILTDKGNEFWKHEPDLANPVESAESPGSAVVDGIVYVPVSTTLWAFDSK
ncbi:MAG: PQQ-binding-like beta-propeller repeat protein [Minicystis sp.]